MNSRRSTNLIFLQRSFLAFFCAALFSFPAAAETWETYSSDSGAYTARMLSEPDIQTKSLLIGANRAVYSEEIASVVSQNPYVNAIKSYVIKLDQTLSSGVTPDEAAKILQREADIYEDYYAARGGELISNLPERIRGYPGADLLYTYKDPKLGLQTVKIKILISESSKLQQIVIGTAGAIDSFKTRDFFTSLIFTDGIGVADASPMDKWPSEPSPLGLFSFRVPPITLPFFPNPPSKKNGTRDEMVSFAFKDPVRDENVYYNIYGYQFSKDLTVDNAKTVLMQNHIKKHGPDLGKKTFAVGTDDKKRKVLDIRYKIKAPKGFPYIQTVRLHGVFQGSSMMVQEIMSSQPLVISGFTDTLIKTADFHPEQYHPPGTELAPAVTAEPEIKPLLPAEAAPQKSTVGKSLGDTLRGAIGQPHEPPAAEDATGAESGAPASP